MKTVRHSRAWPMFLLATPAFVSIWAGWVELGKLTGFGKVRPLPGIADSFEIDTAITLPIGVETYAAYAMFVWLAMNVTERARRFAKWSAITALSLGAGGQVAYHLMAAAGVTSAPWQITAIVACLPVLVLGAGAALAHLVVEVPEPDPDQEVEPEPEPEVKPEPQPEVETVDLWKGWDSGFGQPRPEPEPEPWAAGSTHTQDTKVTIPLATSQVSRPISAPVARRVSAPATTLPTSTRAEFEKRENSPPWLPMTWQEIQAMDGGTKRSAESKLYRWRKA